MAKLTFTNNGDPSVSITDPTGQSHISVALDQGQTQTVDVTMDEYYRLLPTLETLRDDPNHDFQFALSETEGGGTPTLSPAAPGTAPVTGDFTAATGTTYRIDPSASLVITLPDAAENQGSVIVIKNQTDDNSVFTIKAATGNTVEGDTSIAVSGARAEVTLRSDGLDWMVNQPPTFTDSVTDSTTIRHLYIDGTSGDDTNDGLTVSTPVETLTQIRSMLPSTRVINITTMVHCAGTIEAPENTSWDDEKGLQFANWTFNKPLVFSGEDAFVVHDDNSGSGYTVTGSGTASAGPVTSGQRYTEVSGAGWSTNEFIGYYVEDGSSYYAIYRNTADRLYLGDKVFSSGTFNIVKPATVINGAVYSEVATYDCRSYSPIDDWSNYDLSDNLTGLRIQDIRLTGEMYSYSWGGYESAMVWHNVVAEGSTQFEFYGCSFIATTYRMNPDTGVVANVAYRFGFSLADASNWTGFGVYGAKRVLLQDCAVMSQYLMEDVEDLRIEACSCGNGMEITRCKTAHGSNSQIGLLTGQGFGYPWSGEYIQFQNCELERHVYLIDQYVIEQSTRGLQFQKNVVGAIGDFYATATKPLDIQSTAMERFDLHFTAAHVDSCPNANNPLQLSTLDLISWQELVAGKSYYNPKLNIRLARSGSDLLALNLIDTAPVFIDGAGPAAAGGNFVIGGADLVPASYGFDSANFSEGGASVSIAALAPGNSNINFEIVTGAGGSEVVSYDYGTNTYTVTMRSGGSTDDQVATAVNANGAVTDGILRASSASGGTYSTGASSAPLISGTGWYATSEFWVGGHRVYPANTTGVTAAAQWSDTGITLKSPAITNAVATDVVPVKVILFNKEFNFTVALA